MKIMVVDDDTDYGDFARMFLEGEGWDVVMEEREDNAFQRIKEQRPDVVLLDIWMQSREGGWEVLRRLRQDPATEATPVIICSAAARYDIDHYRHLWEADPYTSFLFKPYEIEELLRALQAPKQMHRRPGP